jgi:glutamate-ammonia-ligase adenylyltransferase
VDDVVTLTQAFQLAHGARHPNLRHTGTLGALDAMAKAGLISEAVCRELDHAFVFLRNAEHRRQLGLSDADAERHVQASQTRVREICASIGRLVDS